MAFNLKTNQPMFQQELVKGSDPFAVLGKTMSELDNLIEGRRAEDWASKQDLTTLEGIQGAFKTADTQARKDILGQKQQDLSNLLALSGKQQAIDKAAAETKKLQSEAISKGLETKIKEQNIGKVKITPQIAKNIEDANNLSIQSQNQANQYQGIIDKFDKVQQEMGIGGTVQSGQEFLKRVFGTEDDITAFRADVARLVNSDIVKSLPQGPATDKDIEMIAQGFPTSKSSPEYIRKFAETMVRMKNYEAKFQDTKSQWIQQVGHTGIPDKDITINGKVYKAGTKLTDVSKDLYDTELAKTSTQPQVEGTPNKTDIDIDFLKKAKESKAPQKSEDGMTIYAPNGTIFEGYMKDGKVLYRPRKAQ